MNVHQIASLIANSKKREELPNVKSVNFTKIISLMDKKIRISLFLKTKKISNYITQLAKEDGLSMDDYFCTVGRGRVAKTFIDSRVATFLISEISIEFKYYLINSIVVGGDDIVLECEDVPITAINKIYKN